MNASDQVRILSASPDTLGEAYDVLASGRLAVLPTDTVYGVAADPRAAGAWERLADAKGRDRAKAVQVGVASADAAARFLELSEPAIWIAERYWPGALTIVAQARAPHPFQAADGSLGVRAPAHPWLQTLLERFPIGLALSSANAAGEAPLETAQACAQVFAQAAALVIDGGALDGGVPSTVVDVRGDEPRILRPGPIGEDEINLVWTGRG